MPGRRAMKRAPAYRSPYLKAKVHEEDLRVCRLVPVSDVTAHQFVLAVHGDVGIFLRRRDVARLIFAGQRERIAAYQRVIAVASACREAAASEIQRGVAFCRDCGHGDHVGSVCCLETGREIGPGAPGQRDETIFICGCGGAVPAQAERAEVVA